MRQLRFVFIAFLTSLFVTNTTFLRKTITVLLYGVFSFNSVSPYSFLSDYGKADAAVYPSITVAASDHSDVVQKDEQKVAFCLFGKCVDIPKIPVLTPKVPSGNQPNPVVSPQQPTNGGQKEPISIGTSDSNVSVAGKWQSNWGSVEFNSDLTGHWNQGVGIGQITDGSYEPKTRKLVFHYYQSWNKMNGTATLTLSEDGSSLSGIWTQQSGFNPPGSGGSGGWTMTRVPPCEDKEIQTNYDSNDTGIISGYHHYEVKTIICSTSLSCTVDNVFKLMESNAKYIAPVEYSKPVKNCMHSTVHIPYLGDGTILTVVDEKLHSVTNFTRKDHPLHPGKVVRTISEENKSVIVKTVGDGTGYLPSLNKSKATDLWGDIDAQLKHSFNSKAQ